MPQSEVFRLNVHAKVHVETIVEGCPVLLIDDLFDDPDAVRQMALNGNYDASLAYYPGVHSTIAPALLLPLVTQLAQLLRHVSRIDCSPHDFASDFSLVTTPARDMLAKQKHPHVDGIPLAGVIYLSPGSTVGTSFYRHVPLGLSMLRTEAERQAYGGWMETEGDATQPRTYAVADGGCWEHLHTIPPRYNRLVMYPGNAFHAIAMDDVAPDMRLDTARLTQRLFVTRIGAAA